MEYEWPPALCFYVVFSADPTFSNAADNLAQVFRGTNHGIRQRESRNLHRFSFPNDVQLHEFYRSLLGRLKEWKIAVHHISHWTGLTQEELFPKQD